MKVSKCHLKINTKGRFTKKNMILICIWPLSSHLVDPPPMGTLYMKHELFNFRKEKEENRVIELHLDDVLKVFS